MKYLLYVLVVSVLGALAGTGCGGGNDSSNGPVTSAPVTSGAFVFTVSTPHSRYAKGAPIPVTLTVQNTETQAAVMEFGSCFDYTVQFDRGTSEIWAGPNLGCAGVVRTISIAAGATQTYTISWSATDPLNDPGAYGGVLPTPGVYTILAQFTPSTLNGVVLTQAQEATFAGNPITVTVTP